MSKIVPLPPDGKELIKQEEFHDEERPGDDHGQKHAHNKPLVVADDARGHGESIGEEEEAGTPSPMNMPGSGMVRWKSKRASILKRSESEQKFHFTATWDVANGDSEENGSWGFSGSFKNGGAVKPDFFLGTDVGAKIDSSTDLNDSFLLKSGNLDSMTIEDCDEELRRKIANEGKYASIRTKPDRISKGTQRRRRGSRVENVLNMTETGKKRRRATQLTLLVYTILELFDLFYDLIVFGNFMSSSENRQGNDLYAKFYTFVTVIGMIATVRLVYTQLKGIIQINVDLKGKRNRFAVTDNEERYRLLRGETSEDSPEYQLGEAEQTMKWMYAFLWAALTEDFLNIVLLNYRVFYITEGAAVEDAIVMNGFDYVALMLGGGFLAFKMSYIRDYFSAKARVTQLTKQLLQDAERCFSILDEFDGVHEEEVNKVIVIRSMLEQDLIGHPEHVMNDVVILRYVRSFKNIYETCAAIRKTLNWRIKTNMNELTGRILRENYRWSDCAYADLMIRGNCAQHRYLKLCPKTGTCAFFVENLKNLQDNIITADEYRQYVKEASEIALVIAHHLSMQTKKIVSLTTILDMKDHSIGAALRQQALVTIGSKTGEYMNHVYVVKVNVVNVGKTVPKIIKLFSKFVPTNFLGKLRVWKSDDDEELLGKFPCLFGPREYWNPHILDVTGRYYQLATFKDVSKDVLDSLKILEQELPKAFETLGTVKVLRFFKSCNNDIETTKARLRETLLWWEENDVANVKKLLMENANYRQKGLDHNATPLIREVFDLMGLKWQIGSPTEVALVFTVGKMNLEDLKANWTMEKYMKAYIEHLVYVDLVLDQMSLENRELISMWTVTDVREATLGIRSFVPYSAATSKVVDAHFCGTCAMPFFVYGLPNRLAPVWEAFKFFTPDRVYKKVAFFPATANGRNLIAKRIPMVDLT